VLVRAFRLDGENSEGMAGYGVCIVLFWLGQERGEKLSALYGRGSGVRNEAGVSGRWADPELGRVVIRIGIKEPRWRGILE